ncbi:MAG TPA: glycoside hydrolase family 32 protein [Humisphaera sp.]|nr:glycoside hydrolase family 32 protein [Humisphaera sp.]
MSNQRSVFWSSVFVSLAAAAAIAQTAPARGRGGAGSTAPERTRTITISSDFLQLPLVRGGGRGSLVRFTLEVDGKVQRSVNLAFAKEGEQPENVFSMDVREFKGQAVTLRYRSEDAGVLDRLQLGDKLFADPKLYDGPNRPRFHFSPSFGWMNDINGSYFQDGLYHIFFQYNPATPNAGAGRDMHWGHAVSRDLVRWDQWPVALYPNFAGDVYSGTAVMQREPIPGLNEGVKLPAPVLFFAATSPFSQHIATSPDGGHTWRRYAGNPVVKNIGQGDRDPCVIWHEASKHYIMALYVGGPDTYRFLRSTDLINWEQTSSLPGWFECPEFMFVKSAVTGEELMLLYGCYRSPRGAAEPFNSDSAYVLGRFDGKSFTPVTKVRNAHLGPNYYAALFFANEPKGRSVMMGWTRNTRFPGEPFNQCASLPLLTQIKAINGEDTLCFEPAQEVNALRGQPVMTLRDITAAQAATKLAGLARESALDITVRFRPDTTGTVNLNIRSITFSYDAATQRLKMGPKTTQIHPGQTVDARFLIDHGIVESFWNAGEAAFSIASLHTDEGPAFAVNGNAVIEELVVYPMADIWKK